MSDDITELYKFLEDARETLGDDSFQDMMKKISKGKNKGYWKGKKRSETAKDFLEFFDSKFPNSKKDLFRNVVFTKDIDKYVADGWTPIDNHRKYIEGICADFGLAPTFVDRHLARWCREKMPELLIDVPEWDGTDHISDALDRISVSNISHEHFVSLMKDWFSKIVRRVYQPKIQNRLPIFRGKQGIGKDFCIRAMVAGFGRYANEIDFEQNNKTEVYRLIKNLAVGIIPEFDETNSSSISVLKSVITAESIELRALYKNESESVPIRTSFISASNFEDVLRDSSGNRRFMLFDISHIEHSFELVNGPQITAQAFEMAKEKFSSSTEAEMAMKEILDKETPESLDSLFIEEVHHYLADFDMDNIKNRQDSYRGKIEAGAENIPDRIRWYHIAEPITRIAKKYGFRPKRAQQIMKRAGFTQRDNKNTYYEASNVR